MIEREDRVGGEILVEGRMGGKQLFSYARN